MLQFVSRGEKMTSKKEISFEKDEAVESLRELVRCKTVSFKDSTLEDNTEFEKLINKHKTEWKIPLGFLFI